MPKAKAKTRSGHEPGEAYLDPAAQKALADRLARAEGHLRAVRQMVLDRKCADEILLQLSAVKAALNKVAAEIVDQEMKDCVQSCMEGPVDRRLERLTRAFSSLLKQT